ncbi:hypothetical protein CEUSTIGMA_g2155.t1 [Chlamydomonas eustigma]|uniref:DUF218 domain-containing protein n=1 Tax=Chlamydomonas eustigma TaxID=1157962 RepID=A0A250WV45_9CHLO|nr:hypothetical protein CEUSTIGMA_g2155.t1 [Chlamydomonas eustigma]|eukprot:GAX74707.1 hypothetical protein CEUSTIGMA_g2155.t1 [Chlamydomonas eustigma]
MIRTRCNVHYLRNGLQMGNIRLFLGRIRPHVSSSSSQDSTPATVPWLTTLGSTSHAPSLEKGSESLDHVNGKHITTYPTDLDAIVVLAGGQTTQGSGLPPWVERRLDTCLGFQKLQSKNCPILCLGGGTPHKPPILNDKGYVIHESTACAEYLMSKGLMSSLILKEVSSYDTVGNAFFSLTIHALPAGWRKIMVVTSHFHMPRTQALFEDMYMLASQDLLKDPDRFHFWFGSCSDDGLFSPDVLQVRCEREASSLNTWRRDMRGLQSFSQLHAWLHETHLCYAVSRQTEFGVSTVSDSRLLASY